MKASTLDIRMEGQILQTLEWESDGNRGVFEMALCTNGEMIKVLYDNGKIDVTHSGSSVNNPADGCGTTIFKHEP